MPDEPKPPLTDSQIRKSILSQIEQTMHARLDIRTLEVALLDKGLLTEADIAHAIEKVKNEADGQVARIGDAMKKPPSGGVQ